MPALKPYHPDPLILQGYWIQLRIPCQGVELIEQVLEGFAFATLGHLATVTGFSMQELVRMIGLSTYALRRGRRRDTCRHRRVVDYFGWRVSSLPRATCSVAIK